ncbi:hypothetical protein LAG90_16365 [Marinilongibacter aquaticus]|uniref:hypothetical protein n=1 Tax=Marinilongibacter aquaticus TaxID=2975157 RepID=UPI0021BD1999|nr:hypothetical protein [Marinilongibacter aquaticus]UBM58379.1 hypothetical protein LAG90_16365 [Marinilongibacter aquaticus]
MDQIESILTPIFTTKSPVQLPETWREGLVKYIPWIMLILAPLSLLAIGLGGLSYALDLFSGHFLRSLGMIFSIVAMVVDLLAIKPLFDKSRKGWKLLLLGYVLTLISNILSFSFVGLVLGFLIGGFFLFQIKTYYK